MHTMIIPTMALAVSLLSASASAAQDTNAQASADLQQAIDAHRDCTLRQARARVATSQKTDTAVAIEVKRLCAREESRWATLAAENRRSDGISPAETRKQIARQAYLNAEDDVRALRKKPARSGR
jgi:predicted negative regulator of RcsB-dependent stress response